MTSDLYRRNSLKSWNDMQLKIIKDLNVPPEPDYVSAVAEWFVGLVDSLGRLPTWDEILAFFPAETTQAKKLS